MSHPTRRASTRVRRPRSRSRSPPPPRQRRKNGLQKKLKQQQLQQCVMVEDFLETPQKWETEVKRILAVQPRTGGSFLTEAVAAAAAVPAPMIPPLSKSDVMESVTVRSFVRWTPVYRFSVNLSKTTVSDLAALFQAAVKCPRPIQLHYGGRSLRNDEMTLQEVGVQIEFPVYAFLKKTA